LLCNRGSGQQHARQQTAFQGSVLFFGRKLLPLKQQHHGDHGDAAQNEPGGGVCQGTQMAAANGKGYKAAAPHGGGKHQKDGAAGLFVHKNTLPFMETMGLIAKNAPDAVRF